MGKKLLEFFAKAESVAGIHGKVRLAKLTQVTSTQAGTQEDTRELCHKFESALAQVVREFDKSVGRVVDDNADPRASLGRLRRHQAAYLELMSQRSLFLGRTDETCQRVTEVAAEVLDVARASVWFFDGARTVIRCADLFIRKNRAHERGLELGSKDFPSYFEALGTERTIAAHNAHEDPRTAVFSEQYLKPLGINSMLDVPIWAAHKMVGVVCHEHIGPVRQWSADEETFAYMMSNFVALALERA